MNPAEPGAIVRVGARTSALSRRQAQEVLERAAAVAPHCAFRFVGVRTEGDRTRAPLAVAGGRGLFASALEDALREGAIDLAVHSLKDLPVSLPEGLVLAAVLPREAPWDVLVGGRLEDLPRGARVGSGSPRRARQLARLRPDLRWVAVRGNVPTRLELLARGEVEALVLALAGLRRLGLEDRVSQVLPAEVCLPAPGQGAIAVEARVGEPPPGVAQLNDPDAARAVAAERALLSLLGGGCLSALGCLAEPSGGGRLRLRARLCGAAGQTLEVDVEASPEEVAERAAAGLRAQGAQALLDQEGDGGR